MSSITVWESGISEAPATPCSRRKMTSSGREVATPHRIDARVKPEIEARNIVLRPIFCDSQPESGVMMAVAMM